MGKKKREIPLFGLPIIETHCHLDYLKERPLEETLEEATRVGVDKIITISVEPNNLDTALEYASKADSIYASQGIHPHNGKDFNSHVGEKIKSSLSHEKVVAVGEIGLDFYYNNSPREDQLNAFKAQMDIAIEHDYPVIIHSRDADEETIEILNEKAPQLKRKGVIHSFTSGPELAKCALSHGFCLGFNGIITFNSAQNVRDIVSLCPLEQILLETDAPFLTPVPHRGRENAPHYLPFVAEKIAEIKEVEVDSVLKVCYENSLKLFFPNI